VLDSVRTSLRTCCALRTGPAGASSSRGGLRRPDGLAHAGGMFRAAL